MNLVSAPTDAFHRHYQTALRRRTLASQGAVRQRLETRLAVMPAEPLPASLSVDHPLPLVAAAAPPNVLAELVALLMRQRRSADDNATVGHPPELAALREFRTTWTQLGVDRQVATALGRAPANAGPLNSHHLVLRTLSRLRTLSPAYLQHLVSYVDALLCIEQATKKVKPAGRKSGKAKTP